MSISGSDGGDNDDDGSNDVHSLWKYMSCRASLLLILFIIISTIFFLSLGNTHVLMGRKHTHVYELNKLKTRKHFNAQRKTMCDQ